MMRWFIIYFLRPGYIAKEHTKFLYFFQVPEPPFPIFEYSLNIYQLAMWTQVTTLHPFFTLSI
jgi:hypothetical protein